MTSRRLGILVIALVAVWSLAGLDWLATAPTQTNISIFSVQSAYAGDPDDYATGSSGPPEEPPAEDPPADQDDREEDPSLLEQIVQAVVSFFGDL